MCVTMLDWLEPDWTGCMCVVISVYVAISVSVWYIKRLHLISLWFCLFLSLFAYLCVTVTLISYLVAHLRAGSDKTLGRTLVAAQ